MRARVARGGAGLGHLKARWRSAALTAPAPGAVLKASGRRASLAQGSRVELRAGANTYCFPRLAGISADFGTNEYCAAGIP